MRLSVVSADAEDLNTVHHLSIHMLDSSLIHNKTVLHLTAHPSVLNFTALYQDAQHY